MKLVKRDFERDGSGYAILIPEESEDLWHLYNLVSPGDEVTAITVRLDTSIGRPFHESISERFNEKDRRVLCSLK